MSSDPATERDDQGREGKGTFSHHNIKLPNAASIAAAEDEKEIDETENTSNIHLEKLMEVSNRSIEHQVRILEEKLSAALLDLKAGDETVKQHEKVAVEAVAGWEKAENEVAALKQKLEAATDERSVVEHRANHLDEALRECVWQLRQAREEQEQQIQEEVVKKAREWESARSDLETQILQLQAAVESSKADSDLYYKLEYLENENSALKHELISQSEELEVRTIERDLNAQAAETASKQHLDSIRRLAKLEAENRNLRSVTRKSSSAVDHKSVSVSSMCVESLTDSQSDCGERLNALEMDSIKISSTGLNEGEPSCSESWKSASFAGEYLKKQKGANRSLTNSATEIDLMNDFLEMEHFAALPVTKPSVIEPPVTEPPALSDQTVCEESSPRAKLEGLYHQTYELQEKLEKMEAERTQLDDLLEKMMEKNSALEEKLRDMEKLNNVLAEQKKEVESRKEELTDTLGRMEEEKAELDVTLMDRIRCIEMLKTQVEENGNKVDALHIELNKANELKQYYEQRAIDVECELKTMSDKVDALREEVTVEHARSKKFEVKCEHLEDALLRQKQEVELELTARLNAELKIKQEDLAVAALKLSECQHTIMSLGNQLKSLATLEDFIGDGVHLSQLINGGSLIPGPGGDLWRMHSNSAFLAKRETLPSNIPAKECKDHAISCSSSKLTDQIDGANEENGQVFPNSVEDISQTAP